MMVSSQSEGVKFRFEAMVRGLCKASLYCGFKLALLFQIML